jgi:deoxycytidylate deaminase
MVSTETPAELYFGLIGAIGTDLDSVQDVLKSQLARLGYKFIIIKLSKLLYDLKGDPWEHLPQRSDARYYEDAMNAGDQLCKRLKRGDAMAALAMNAVNEQRKLGVAGSKVAYIFNSLKRPQEVDLLRKTYGSLFFALSSYSPRAARVDRLAGQLATAQHKNHAAPLRADAEKLIQRDEGDPEEYGQDIRRTFPKADVFLNAGTFASLEESVTRFVELLFGDMWHTPTRDEEGMALAYLARVRSASPARQVGAAITGTRGQVLAIGTNEVPKARGGQYWTGDPGDGRDFVHSKQDSSDKMRRNILSDVLNKLVKAGLLDRENLAVTKILDGATDTELFMKLRESQLFDTIDYVRSVHAEMAAILSVSTRSDLIGATLYATTYPCHECARHIVMSGITKVVYVEPYPKSLVSDLFSDSIDVDGSCNDGQKVTFVPFVGIAPSVYSQLFHLGNKKRKEKDGTIIKWNSSTNFPHTFTAYSENNNRVLETKTIDDFNTELMEIGAIERVPPVAES